MLIPIFSIYKNDSIAKAMATLHYILKTITKSAMKYIDISQPPLLMYN